MTQTERDRIARLLEEIGRRRAVRKTGRLHARLIVALAVAAASCDEIDEGDDEHECHEPEGPYAHCETCGECGLRDYADHLAWQLWSLHSLAESSSADTCRLRHFAERVTELLDDWWAADRGRTARGRPDDGDGEDDLPVPDTIR
jgi:hypothetical protein